MATIGLVLHPTADVTATVTVLAGWAGRYGTQVVIGDDQAHRLDGIPAARGVVAAVPAAELVDRCVALVSLGGDGTMLGSLRRTVGTGVPVLGVNLGHVGMLVEVGADQLPEALDRVSRRDFAVETHPALHITGPRLDRFAFNDLALVRTPGSGFVSVSLAVDGSVTGAYRCDALVVSTALGSTAYNYAAGGPVISPAVRALVVTPAAPASGIARPLVVAPSEQLRLTLAPGTRDVAVEVDGQVADLLGGGDVLDVAEVADAGSVVRLDPVAHHRASRVKLSLLNLPLLPEELTALTAGRVPRHGRRHDAPEEPATAS